MKTKGGPSSRRHQYLLQIILCCSSSLLQVTIQILCSSENMDVKTLDFSKFQGSEAARSEFAHELLKAFSNAGVVKLINHGFDGETMSRLFRWVIILY